MERFKKVLVVEDEPGFSKSLFWELENQGATVTIATDGKTGLDKALENHPDLIFLDVMLPIMDGLALLRELRKDEWGKNARIILLTEVDNPNTIAEAMENGVHKYFIKTDHSIFDIVEGTKKYFADNEPQIK